MNYRHVYHAGNHTEVFKHSVLVMLLEHLRQKPQPFMVLDTHAGIGVYDLNSEQALKTDEKSLGVEKIYHAAIPSSSGYVALLHDINGEDLKVYPGSPEIIRRLMRNDDRLVACELHLDDCETLARRYRHERHIKVQNRSGYEAIKALLPPPLRRGLVFVDPPYEETNETQQLIAALSIGMRKWATGIFCLWYPVKDSAIGDALEAAVLASAYPKALRVEFLPFAQDNERLCGSGIILCNTPWQFSAKVSDLCRDLAGLLGSEQATWSVKWLTDKND